MKLIDFIEIAVNAPKEALHSEILIHVDIKNPNGSGHTTLLLPIEKVFINASDVYITDLGLLTKNQIIEESMNQEIELATADYDLDDDCITDFKDRHLWLKKNTCVVVVEDAEIPRPSHPLVGGEPIADN